MKKLIVLLIILSTSTAFADHTYYCYGNSYILQSVFNSLAMIYKIDGYSTIIKIVAMLGMLFAIITTMQTKRLVILSYILTLFIVGSMFYWKKDTLIIEDVVLNETYIVDNIPYGYATLGEFVTTAGKFFTEAFDTLFAVPTTSVLFGSTFESPIPISYSEAGYAAPFNAMQQQLDLTNFRYYKEFTEYFNNCLFWDISGASSDELSTFFHNTDVYSTNKFPNGLSSNVSLPVQIGSESTTCNQYYSTLLYPSLSTYVSDHELLITSEPKLAKVLAAQSASASLFTGYAYSTMNLNMQQAVAKATIESIASSSNNYNEYSAFIAEYGLEQMQTQGSVLAKFAMKIIPIFKNVMEVILIAFLPIMLILMIALGGIKIVKNYIMSLVWIQLFNPIMAVITFIINMSAVWQSRAHMQITNSLGYSIANMGYINDFTQSYIAVAGYLLLAVPAIATAILYGGQWASSQLMGSIASSGYSAAGMSTNASAVQQQVNVSELANPTRGIDIQRFSEGNTNHFVQDSMFQSATGNALNASMESLGGLSSFANDVGRSNMLNTVSSASANSKQTYDNVRSAANQSSVSMLNNAAEAISSGNHVAGDKFTEMAKSFQDTASMSDIELAKMVGTQNSSSSIAASAGRIAGGNGMEGSTVNSSVVAANNMDTDVFKATERQSETAALKQNGVNPVNSGQYNAAVTTSQVVAGMRNGLKDGKFTEDLTAKQERNYASIAGENSVQTPEEAFDNAVVRTLSENAQSNAYKETFESTDAAKEFMQNKAVKQLAHDKGYYSNTTIGTQYEAGNIAATDTAAQVNAVKSLFKDMDSYNNFKTESAMFNTAMERGNLEGAMHIWKSMGNVEKAAFAESQLLHASRESRINNFTNDDGTINLTAARNIASKIATMEQADAYAFTKAFNNNPKEALKSYESQQLRKYLTDKETEAFKNQQGITPMVDAKISAQAAAWTTVKTDASNKGLNYAYDKPEIGKEATRSMVMSNAVANVTEKYAAKWIENRGIQNIASTNALEAENKFRENSAYQNDISSSGVAEGLGHARFGAQIRDGFAVNYFTGKNNASHNMQSIINVSSELRAVDNIPVAGRLLTDTVVLSSAGVKEGSSAVSNFVDGIKAKFSENYKDSQ